MRNVSPIFPLGLGCVFAFGIFILEAALYRVQVTEAAESKEIQKRQVTRRIRIPALRGRILDVKDRPLATCRARLDIVCHIEAFQKNAPLANTAQVIDREVGRLMNMLDKPREVEESAILRHLRKAGALPLTILKDIDFATLAHFEERAFEFPGFEVFTLPSREYPYGSLAAHVLGYVGLDRPESPEDILPIHFFEPEMKGRSGLEKFYNRYLTGAAGARTICVDARGLRPSMAAPTPAETTTAPTPGLDLKLTLDAEVQLSLERELAGLCGAGVVIDPRDGAIRALASAPAFDPNRFMPFDAAYYRGLSTNDAKPLLNRAVSGVYPPGSTFKPIVAAAAFRAGWAEDANYTCTGSFRGTRCWNWYGHGPLTMRAAIEHSCNTFFLNLQSFAGTNAVVAEANLFGLGRPTGLDFPTESGGALHPWRAQSAIGQGDLLVTPLQMAVVTAALANGGKVFRPYLHRASAEHSQGTCVAEIGLAPAQVEVIRRGMRDVVETGTGRRIRTRFGAGKARYPLAVTCAGKTGTAERGAQHKNTVWVIAFAPYEAPTVAIALVIEEGESGGITAAPHVHNVLKTIFGERVEG